MNRTEIRRAQFAKPFRPFAIHLTDGNEFMVDRPEFLLHSRSGQNIIFLTPDDRYQSIDLRQVSRLSGTDLPEEPAPTFGTEDTDAD
jgi:hypothetical protein